MVTIIPIPMSFADELRSFQVHLSRKIRNSYDFHHLNLRRYRIGSLDGFLLYLKIFFLLEIIFLLVISLFSWCLKTFLPVDFFIFTCWRGHSSGCARLAAASLEVVGPARSARSSRSGYWVYPGNRRPGDLSERPW